jgi:hypothetical protein
VLTDQRPDAEDLKADIDAIRHGLLVGVLRHEILLEEAQRVLRRRCRETNKVRVKVLQHLTPHTVDGSVTLVRDDEVEVLNREGWVVGSTGRSSPSSLLHVSKAEVSSADSSNSSPRSMA